MTTFERIRAMLCKAFPSGPEGQPRGILPTMVTEKATFVGDLQLDSLGLVKLMLEIEDEFGVDISFDDQERLINGTVGDVVSYIDQQRGNKARHIKVCEGLW